jgi:flavin reductase (DIM6/NTAB) family NADH-FMN oxidoreductase RutF
MEARGAMSLACALPGLKPLDLWSAIGLDEPQQSLVDVTFDGGDQQRDVTRDQVVLSLAPLLIAIGDVEAAPGHQAILRFHDRARGVELGSLDLLASGNIEAAGKRLRSFSVEGSRHACLPAPLRAWQRWLHARRKSGDKGSFSMTPASVQDLLVFYICPRPVMLVSVADAQHENLFPMDLVGSIGGLFTLALRQSSPSVATMTRAKRAVLADVPLAEKSLAYSLGAHHRVPKIDWSSVPCETVRSSHFGLRVPAQSPRVRELEIIDSHERGSHTVFLCRIISEELRAPAPRLFHTSGIHQAWRQRRGPPPWREAVGA